MKLQDFMLRIKHSGMSEAEVRKLWLTIPDREDVDENTLNETVAFYVSANTTRASEEEKRKAERYNSVEARLDRLEAAVKELQTTFIHQKKESK